MEKIASFRFLGYKIKESSIRIDTVRTADSNINVNFERTVGVNTRGNQMKLDFVTSITNANDTLSIKVKAEGYFEFDQGQTEETLNVFFKTSAPAILFPYIRAYISALTSLSGIQPVILPTLNLSQR